MRREMGRPNCELDAFEVNVEALDHPVFRDRRRLTHLGNLAVGDT
jgi:hypothetical protein